jgi:hypothetical protein
MVESRKLRPMAEAYCKEHRSKAQFFIQDDHPSGQHHLVVQYEQGGYDGDKEFVTAVPQAWTEAEIHDVLLWPMRDARAPYPPWEVPTRVYGSDELFRWWKGEKAK